MNNSWFFYLGTGLIAIGSLAVLFSSLSSLIELIYFGMFLCVLGIFEGVHALKIRPWNNLFLHEFMGIVYIAGGLLIAADPISDESIVTLLHAFFFITCGILRIIFSFEKETQHKKWLFFNGLITCIIGLLIAFEWPESGLWVIGALIGIDAIMTGWTWIMLSYEAHT
jgi:uncharacterized membrane protein HdeD (DUF308 family)